MGKKGYILSGAALLAALALLAGCGKNNGTEDKNKDKPDTDPAQEIVLVQPEAADVPVDFETAQKAWPDAYAYMKIPNATGCAIREGGFIAQHPVDDATWTATTTRPVRCIPRLPTTIRSWTIPSPWSTATIWPTAPCSAASRATPRR